MNRKIIFVLGSGFSKGSGYTLEYFNNTENTFPCDKDFFTKGKKFIKNINSETLWNDIERNNDYECILKIKELAPDSDSLEGFWNYIDQLRRFIFDSGLISEKTFNIQESTIQERCFPKKNIKEKRYLFYHHNKSQPFSPICAAGNEMRKLICEVFGHFNVPHKKNIFNTLAKKIYNIRQSISVITFNYDLIMEDILGKNKIDSFYYNLEKSDVDKIEFLKLHGSFNWIQELDGHHELPIRINKDRNIVKCEREAYPFHYKLMQPAIVTPDIFKQPITQPNSTPESVVSSLILNQWKHASKRLSNAKKIIFLGFGFPPADFHAQVFFRTFLSDKSKKSVKLYCCKLGEDINIERRRIKSIIGPNKFLYKGLEESMDAINSFI